MSKPTIICLTPVKNEAWILTRFLQCASLWADHIIVADQGSDDGSREIALRFPKVILVENPSPTFNEPERQQILLEAARRIQGRRVLIALDADEFLTANCFTSPEWNALMQAPEGTVLYFDWPTILADPYSFWIYPTPLPLGFVDNGYEHVGEWIHSPRIPLPPAAARIYFKDIKVMHFVGTDIERWKSKIRWYQIWEWLHQYERNISLIDLYRFYHKDLDIPTHMVKPLPKEWIAEYEQHGIDMTSVCRPAPFRWDHEVLQLFEKHGMTSFKKLAIWDVNWARIYREIHGQGAPIDVSDPRSRLDKFIHRWLRRTQPYFSHFGPTWPLHVRLQVYFIHRFLSLIRW